MEIIAIYLENNITKPTLIEKQAFIYMPMNSRFCIIAYSACQNIYAINQNTQTPEITACTNKRSYQIYTFWFLLSFLDVLF